MAESSLLSHREQYTAQFELYSQKVLAELQAENVSKQSERYCESISSAALNWFVCCARRELAELKAQLKAAEKAAELERRRVAEDAKRLQEREAQLKAEQDRKLAEEKERQSEANLCDICFEARKDAVLQCGHLYCRDCADQLKQDNKPCAVCNQPIKLIIPMYT